MPHELEEEYELSNYLNSTKEYVLFVLRTMPELRRINKRYELWQKVSELSKGRVNYETVSRLCRQIQNTEGKFIVEDNRNSLEKGYREYFKQ